MESRDSFRPGAGTVQEALSPCPGNVQRVQATEKNKGRNKKVVVLELEVTGHSRPVLLVPHPGPCRGSWPAKLPAFLLQVGASRHQALEAALTISDHRNIGPRKDITT